MNAQLKLVPSYQREALADVLDEMKPLLDAHFHEITHYPDIPLKVDYDFFLAADAKGALRVYTARFHGELIGYCVFFVSPNPKYLTSLQAHQSVLYLSAQHRRGRVGLRLIDWCDTQLRAEGVQVVYHHMKARHGFGRLFAHLGYELIDEIWGRRLDRG
jgi:GNAT superfamily N-acetyltransferase